MGTRAVGGPVKERSTAGAGGAGAGMGAGGLAAGAGTLAESSEVDSASDAPDEDTESCEGGDETGVLVVLYSGSGGSAGHRRTDNMLRGGAVCASASPSTNSLSLPLSTARALSPPPPPPPQSSLPPPRSPSTAATAVRTTLPSPPPLPPPPSTPAPHDGHRCSTSRDANAHLLTRSPPPLALPLAATFSATAIGGAGRWHMRAA